MNRLAPPRPEHHPPDATRRLRSHARPLERTPRRTPGFTLVETLVVLAVLASLALAALAWSPGAVERRRVAALADQTAAVLHAARTVSQALGHTLRVSALGDAGGTCLAVHTGPRDACACPAGDRPRCDAPAQLLAVVQAPARDGVSLRTTTASAVYDPVLGTVTPALSVRLEGARGIELRQVVNLTGRVRGCVAAGAMPGWPAC